MSLLLRTSLLRSGNSVSHCWQPPTGDYHSLFRLISSQSPIKQRHEQKKKIRSKLNKAASENQVRKSDSARISIDYHNGGKTGSREVLEFPLDKPPVLFIKKYNKILDTRDLVFKDEFSELEKSTAITPETLTGRRLKYIQDAVRQSKTFEKLSEKFTNKQADPILTPKVGSGEELKRSVFTDSDFEVVRTESVQGLQKMDSQQDTEWLPTTLKLADLHKYYLNLSKFRLTMLVCMTATAGYAMAPIPFDPYIAMCATLGTAMASAAANSINQILEVPFDSQMNRTKNRVLVRGCVSPFHAFMFATVMAGVGTTLLYTQVNGLCASLSLLNLFLYTSVYTPLKRVSIVNTWVGSVVGAIPPLIGWSAATGSLEPGAFILAGILYSWQFPHFNSLSWNLRPDYSRAGYRMMSVTHPDLCRRVALRHSLACIGICTLAPVLDVTTWTFALDSLVCNVYLTYLAYKFYNQADSKSSRNLFRFTLVHLPLLMIFMWVGKKSTKDDDSEDSWFVFPSLKS